MAFLRLDQPLRRVSARRQCVAQRFGMTDGGTLVLAPVDEEDAGGDQVRVLHGRGLRQRLAVFADDGAHVAATEPSEADVADPGQQVEVIDP